MHRRRFLKATATAAAFSSVARAAHPAVACAAGGGAKSTITDVKVLRLVGTRKTTGVPWQSQVQPLHIYPEHRPTPAHLQEPGPPGTTQYRANYLRIETDSGIEGLYGPVDDPAAVVVDRQLRGFLIGRNALAGERLWDQMYRLNRHARSGHFMMAISAVDNALWDLRGRYYEAPVYQLLGGPTREAVDIYGSTLGTALTEGSLRETSRALKSEGFVRQKWFLPYGPGDGPEGLEKNVEMVRFLREAVGDDADLMFDAFMGWDLNYARAWAQQVERYRPRWIEEAFSPDKLNSFVQLSRSTRIPVATGEHFYNRWEVQRFLDAGAVSVVQADPEWCGGVSELAKICTLASAHDVHVVPHGHNLHAALHVVASQSPMTCPMAEYLIDKMGHYYMFERHQLMPVNGRIALPDRPGFGITFDESSIDDMHPVTWRD